ncbi:hypothetical protein [Pseudotabrizicola alkalilacus]|uniref:Uncharacterized protein n=1 Tax=Pseudotabrizicola alkalilacus TaxID=2305252 RepID=A0A411YXP7_9RHOB|nr:hypothetical protein [Pseudotabrizicola alkalilacus]RGP35636.1 hypothetical protein D1012_18785 [Pseudotabrizicola alkalilacus]
MRDDTMGELVALRERSAELHNDLEAIDRILCAMGFEGELEGRQIRQSRLVIFHRNELRQFLLRELRKGEPLSSRDLAERICGEEGKDIRDVRMVLDVTRRVSKAMRLLLDQKAVRGEKDRMRRYVWRLAG